METSDKSSYFYLNSSVRALLFLGIKVRFLYILFHSIFRWCSTPSRPLFTRSLPTKIQRHERSPIHQHPRRSTTIPFGQYNVSRWIISRFLAVLHIFRLQHLRNFCSYRFTSANWWMPLCTFTKKRTTSVEIFVYWGAVRFLEHSPICVRFDTFSTDKKCVL